MHNARQRHPLKGETVLEGRSMDVQYVNQIHQPVAFALLLINDCPHPTFSFLVNCFLVSSPVQIISLLFQGFAATTTTGKH